MKGWAQIRKIDPWPDAKPSVPTPKVRGWLSEGTRAMLTRHLPSAGLVVELGSWIGLSARFMLGTRPRLRLVCVDHWEGSRELRGPAYDAMYPVLEQTFRAECWEFRDQIAVLSSKTIDGLKQVADCGMSPDLVYVDASHEEHDVREDVVMAGSLFPQADLVGDDWRLATVAAGATTAAAELGRRLDHNDRAWYLPPAETTAP